jgi:hypothetical protein
VKGRKSQKKAWAKGHDRRWALVLNFLPLTSHTLKRGGGLAETGFLGKIPPFFGKIGKTNFPFDGQIIRGLSRVRGRLAEGMGKSRAKSPKSCRFRGNLAKVNDRLAVWRHSATPNIFYGIVLQK